MEIPYNLKVSIAKMCSEIDEWKEDTNTSGVIEEELAYKQLYCSNPVVTSDMIESALTPEVPILVTGLIGFILCIFGLLGNCLAIAVLTKKIYTPSTYVFLLALSIVDSCILVLKLLLNLNDMLNVWTPNSVAFNIYKTYSFPYINPLLKTAHMISIWLTMAFTVDRYLMICHPFQGLKYCNRRQARIAIAFIFAFGFIYNIPNFLEHKVKTLYFQDEALAVHYLTKTGKSWFYLVVYDLVCYLVFVVCIPFIMLAVLNIKLVQTVKKVKLDDRKRGCNGSGGQCTDTTIMLMAVVVVFFICQTPALAYHIIWATTSGRLVNNRTGCEAYCITREVSSLLVTLNSSVNVLLYYLFSDKFRCELRLICCHCVMRNSCPTTRLDSRATQKTAKYTLCQMQNTISLKPNGSNTSGDEKIALGTAGQSNPRTLVRQITTCSTVELTQEAAEMCGIRGDEASAAV